MQRREPGVPIGIRVEGGPRLGWGHLVRCREISARLGADGYATRFFVDDTQSRLWLEEQSQPVHPFPDRPAARGAGRRRADGDLLREARAGRIRAVVLDLPQSIYDRSETTLMALSATDAPVIMLDNAGPTRRLGTLTILGLCHQRLGRAMPGPGRVVDSRSYVVLPSACRDEVRRKRQITAAGRNVLVCSGGTDLAGMSSRVARALEASRRPFAVRLVCGPANRYRPQLERQFGGDARFEVLGPQPSLAPHLLWADVAVLGIGVSSCEAAALGTPVVLLNPRPFHDAVARAFARSGSALALGVVRAVPLTRIRRAIERLLSSPARRRRMAARGRRFIDGRGLDRVMRLMIGTIGAPR